MAKRKRNYEGTGVWVRTNRHGSLYAQYVDPRSGLTVRVAFSKLVKEGKISSATKTAAQGWISRLQADLVRWKSEGVTLEEIGNPWSVIEGEYLKQFKQEHGEKSADFLAKFHLSYWWDFVSKRGLKRGADLKKQHLSAFRASLGADLKPSYRNRIMGAVRAFLGWAADHEYVAITRGNLKTFLKDFKTETGLPRVLSTAEIGRLIKALPEHDNATLQYQRSGRYGGSVTTAANRREPLAPLVLLLLLTGCRIGEALSLKVADCDVEQGRLRVWGSKTGKMREVVADKSPALHALLKTLKLKAGKSKYLLGDWQDKEGNPIPRELHHRQWKRLATLAGLEGTPIKALRATAVAYFASAGAESEYLLEARFGHSGDVSRRYYRQPLQGIQGGTLEEWYGAADELDATMTALDLKAATRPARVV